MDFKADHFALFSMNRAFRLDLSDLDSRYRDIQAQVHPDRFVNAGEASARLSMQWATHANEAYLTLKKPLKRAKYLLVAVCPAMTFRQKAIPRCRPSF
jgi:molecular chaperone HscB